MTEECIITGNRLIAEFMGTGIKMGPGDLNGYNFPVRVVSGDFDSLFESDCGFAHELLYHESWDWLMPVVEKVYLVRGVSMEFTPGSLEILYVGKKGYRNSVCVAEMKGIECWWACLVDFIDWYNKNVVSADGGEKIITTKYINHDKRGNIK